MVTGEKAGNARRRVHCFVHLFISTRWTGGAGHVCTVAVQLVSFVLLSTTSASSDTASKRGDTGYVKGYHIGLDLSERRARKVILLRRFARGCERVRERE